MSLLGSGLFPAREGTRGEPTTHSHGRKAEEQSIHPQTGFWKHEQVQESESLFQIRSGSNNPALGFCRVGADQLVETRNRNMINTYCCKNSDLKVPMFPGEGPSVERCIAFLSHFTELLKVEMLLNIPQALIKWPY